MQKFNFLLTFLVAFFVGCGNGSEGVDAGPPAAAVEAPAAEVAPAAEPAATEAAPAAESAVSEAPAAEAVSESAPVVESH